MLSNKSFKIAGFVSLLISSAVYAQVDTLDVPTSLTEVNLSGPRLGLSGAVSNGAFLDELRKNKMDRVFSQFGWQFEYKIVPEGGGPAFIVEIIPLVGAVEYGKILPSINVPIGIRFPNGFEFGIGPQATIISSSVATTALVMAAGKTFLYKGVGLPVNFAVIKGSGGYSAAFMFGYALVKSRSLRPGSTTP
jgi:hypothetical protein